MCHVENIVLQREKKEYTHSCVTRARIVPMTMPKNLTTGSRRSSQKCLLAHPSVPPRGSLLLRHSLRLLGPGMAHPPPREGGLIASVGRSHARSYDSKLVAKAPSHFLQFSQCIPPLRQSVNRVNESGTRGRKSLTF